MPRNKVDPGFGDRLRELVVDWMQIDIAEAARRCDIPYATFQGYLQHHSFPKRPHQLKLAQGLRANINYLFTGKGAIQLSVAYQQHLQAPEGSDAAAPTEGDVDASASGQAVKRAKRDRDSQEGLITVPMYDVRAAAGDGALNDDQPDVVRIFRFPEWWLRQVAGVQPKNAQVIVADGNSMRPEVNHGDLLILDTDIASRRPDGLYVFLLDGMVSIKKLQFLPGKKVRVISTNPDYQNYEVELKGTPSHGFQLVARVALHGQVL